MSLGLKWIFGQHLSYLYRCYVQLTTTREAQGTSVSPSSLLMHCKHQRQYSCIILKSEDENIIYQYRYISVDKKNLYITKNSIGILIKVSLKFSWIHTNKSRSLYSQDQNCKGGLISRWLNNFQEPSPIRN